MNTVRDATYQLLREFGMTTIFGNLGSTEQPFLKNFPGDFRYVLGLQEASVVGMADGYSQAMRRPVLVNLHTAAGTGNAMGNIMSAFQNKTPLVITAGQQTREMSLLEPYLTNVEPTVLPRPWVKWAFEPARAKDIPAAFMRAIATALQPPAGPVYLSLPLNDWEEPSDAPAIVRSVSQRIAPDPERLAQFADKMMHASKPVLIYGGSVARAGAWNDAVAVAEAIGAPVWVAPAPERAPFPQNHPLLRGVLPFAMGPLSEKLHGHDVALVIGAPVFRYYPYVPGSYLPDGMQLMHISDDPSETARAPVGDSLLGDAGLALAALKGLFRGHKPKTALPKAKAEQPSHAPEKGASDGRLSAAQVFGALSEVRPRNAILVEETPSNVFDLAKAWPITEPDTFYTFASGGLGWGLPASVGVALAERDAGRNRPVTAVIGDGSFQYSVQAIWSATQLKLPMLFVVMRNEEYCILKSFAKLEQTPGVPGLELPGMDFVSIARGYGCDAARVDNPNDIKKAAAEAWRKEKPTVLEIPFTREVPPLIS